MAQNVVQYASVIIGLKQHCAHIDISTLQLLCKLYLFSLCALNSIFISKTWYPLDPVFVWRYILQNTIKRRTRKKTSAKQICKKSINYRCQYVTNIQPANGAALVDKIVYWFGYLLTTSSTTRMYVARYKNNIHQLNTYTHLNSIKFKRRAKMLYIERVTSFFFENSLEFSNLSHKKKLLFSNAQFLIQSNRKRCFFSLAANNF